MKAIHASTDELWAELERRGAAVQCGYAYPAMCSDDSATNLVEEHGYEYGPWQLIELGHRLAEPPQWPVYARLPSWARRARSSYPATRAPATEGVCSDCGDRFDLVDAASALCPCGGLVRRPPADTAPATEGED